MSQPEFSTEERQELLRVAHQAVEAHLEGERWRPVASGPHLDEPRGAFTTIHVDGALHGCVGYVGAVTPLIQTIAETAVSAAFQDPRFPKIHPDEAARMKVEISVLSLPFAITPEQVEVGVHGLIISHHGRRGLLLPQVATEHQLSREQFLEMTCMKAGLSRDAWRKGAELEAFTAEVFGEE
jgi:AmmeMemoRadiSam system protein A